MNEETLKKYYNEEGELDFNKVIPKPEIFSHIKFQLYSQKTSEIEAKFMNFVIHKEEVLEKENINDLIMLFLNKLGEKLEGKNFEEILKNNPENETALALAPVYCETFYGKINAAYWCAENWGTKWNASDQYNCEDYIEFTTAWSMPDKIIEKIIKENPNEPLKILFNDEVLGENCGIWQYFPLGERKIQETGEVKISVSYDPHNLKINYDNQEENSKKNAIKVKLPHGDLIIYTDATDNPNNEIEKNKKWFIFAGGEEEEWNEIYGED
jgi:hypothetical protein